MYLLNLSTEGITIALLLGQLVFWVVLLLSGVFDGVRESLLGIDPDTEKMK